MDKRTYDVLIKPVGDKCNLKCGYCYYSGKRKVLGQKSGVMPEELLWRITQQIIEIHGKDAQIRFNWHGGEPLLAGTSFYNKAVIFQNTLKKQFREQNAGRELCIVNTLQTNGTLLDYKWCRFFKEHQFHIGISTDGPKPYHDAFRRGPKGGSFEDMMAGLHRLQEYKIPYSILMTVNSVNVQSPDEIYEFLRNLAGAVQFLPVTECIPAEFEANEGFVFAVPPGIHSPYIKHPVADVSVNPVAFGKFMCRIHELWSCKDKGRLHIQMFDVAEEKQRTGICGLCTMDMVCGHSICIEQDGKVYSCDRYAFPEYLLGNIKKESLGVLAEKTGSLA